MIQRSARCIPKFARMRSNSNFWRLPWLARSHHLDHNRPARASNLPAITRAVDAPCLSKRTESRTWLGCWRAFLALANSSVKRPANEGIWPIRSEEFPSDHWLCRYLRQLAVGARLRAWKGGYAPRAVYFLVEELNSASFCMEQAIG